MFMANMTLAIPDELRTEMKKFPEIKWSEVARTAIIERLNNQEKLKLVNKLLEKSQFTRKDAEEINKKVKSSSSKRFKELAKKSGHL